MSKGFHVAIVGATGAVGQELMIVFQERNFPISELTLLASARSHGKKLKYCGDQLTIFEAKPDSFQGVDLAFFAGGPVSKELVPEAVKRGAVAIDNSSAFRLHPDVPLVVPEVNPDDVENHKGIISNPNCSTTIFVVPLKPIHQAARVKRVVVTTMQAVSGAGRAAVDELLQQTSQVLAGEEVDQPRVFDHQIAFNLIPHIDVEAGLAIAEIIVGMSKPTVSLVLGGGHSIGVPVAVSSRFSFIAETATMTIHPIRLSGLVIGVPQTYEYLDKMQDRVIRFVEEHSRISQQKFRELMFQTGELARDIGTVLVGKDAVDVGLIDAAGGIGEALKKLQDLIKEQKEKEGVLH
jgi:hypothetical protein